MFFYVYVLKNKVNGRLYIGSSNNLKTRIQQHNKGKEFYTRRYKPWQMVYYEAYNLEELARIREKRLKYHGNAKRELLKRITI